MRPPLFLVLLVLSAAFAAGASAKLINLKTGDTLEGEVLEETEEMVTVRLLRGTTIKIPRTDIESIEEPLPTPSPIPMGDESSVGINESLGPRPGEPTPTPIPIVPISVRFKRVEFPAQEEGVSSVLADPGSESSVLDALPRQSESEIIGLGNSFGRVFSVESGNKYKPFHGTWLPIRSGQSLMIGDRVHAIASALEVVGESGTRVGVYSPGQSQLLLDGVTIEEGRSWVANTGEGLVTATINGVTVELRKGGVLGVEFLRSGFRLNLLEGEARLRVGQEDRTLVEKAVGPRSYLLGIERNIISEGDLPATSASDWKAWNETFSASRNNIAEALAGVEGFSGDPTDPRTIDQYAQLERIAQSLQDFHAHVGRFPHEQGGGLKELFENPGEGRWNGPYLPQSRFPVKDVWGSDIQYRLRSAPGGGLGAEILSPGPDRTAQGGEGDDLGLLVAPPSP